MRGPVAGVLLASLAAACATGPEARPAEGPAATAPRGTPTRPRAVPVERRLDVRWHRQLTRRPPLEINPIERSRPAWDAETGWVFVGDRFGTVRALDSVGRAQWQDEGGAAVEAGLVLAGDLLYVASVDGRVRALDRATGKPVWTYQADTELATTPTLTAGHLLVPSVSDTLIALDAATGEFQWIHRRPRPEGLTIRGASRAVVVGERVFTGYSDGTVFALRLDDGQVLWSKRIDAQGRFRDVDATPVVFDGRLFAASFGGRLVALDARDGTLLWEHETGAGAVALARSGDMLIVAAGREVTAHRLLDGRPVWQTGLTDAGPTDLVLVDELVLLGTSEGPVYGLRVKNGRPFNAFAPGSGVSAPPVRTPEGLWIWSNGGHLFRLAWR